MNVEQHILCLAARTQINADDERRLVELLNGQLDWEELWRQGHLHDVLPLLAMNFRHLQDQIAIPSKWLERAQRRLYSTLFHNTRLADELLHVLNAMADAGIAALPVKGVVLAETVYSNLALRPAADLDVLVQLHDLPAARAVLHSLGFKHKLVPSFEELHHPFHDPQYFRQVAGGEICCELHRALWSPRFFHLDVDSLWQRVVDASLHGAQVKILSPEDTLLHLVIHRTQSPLRLRFLCDIAELLRRHHNTLDWDYVVCQASVGGARTALWIGLSLAHELLGGPIPSKVLPQLRINPIKQRVLEYTCGATALFRPTSSDDLSQQPSLKLRIGEQDHFSHILRAFCYSLVKTSRKHVHNQRRARRSGPSRE